MENCGHCCCETTFAPLRELNKAVRAAGVEIPDRSLRMRLNDVGYQSCGKKIPRLTERMKKVRLAFAKECSKFGVEYWEKLNINIRPEFFIKYLMFFK